jgi:hypothetical protein
MKKKYGSLIGIISKLSLAISDILFFNLSIIISYLIIYKLFGGISNFVPNDEFWARIFAHFAMQHMPQTHSLPNQ